VRAETVRLGRAAAKKAKKALEIRASLPVSQRFGTPAGLAQARKIAKNEPIDPVRTSAFLRRFRPIYLKAYRSGHRSPKTSKAIGAWDLWGGTPAHVFFKAQARKRSRNI